MEIYPIAELYLPAWCAGHKVSGSADPLRANDVRKETCVMMNQTEEWMQGWAGGGMWVWTVVGTLRFVLLIVTIRKLTKQ